MAKRTAHEESVRGFLRLDEAVAGVREAAARGDIASVKEHVAALERAQTEVAPALYVKDAARLLGMSPPTVRSWADRGLLEQVAVSPRRVSFESVRRVAERLDRLRDVAAHRERFELLLEQLEDRRALAGPDARRGFDEALAGETVALDGDD